MLFQVQIMIALPKSAGGHWPLFLFLTWQKEILVQNSCWKYFEASMLFISVLWDEEESVLPAFSPHPSAVPG